jgi:paraquat-inducible protein B
VNTGRYYLNKKDYDTIKEKILNVKNFRVSLNGFALLGDVKFGDSNIFWIDVDSGYEINLNIETKLTNFKVDYKNNVRDIDKTELDEILNDVSNGEIYVDYLRDELFDDVLMYIWNIKTLVDKNTMSLNTYFV